MTLLNNRQGKITLLNFEMSYGQTFGVSFTTQTGHPGVTVLLQVSLSVLLMNGVVYFYCYFNLLNSF